MIKRLEGYTGTGFNERKAYINLHNGLNYLKMQSNLKNVRMQIKKETNKNSSLTQENQLLGENKNIMKTTLGSDINYGFTDKHSVNDNDSYINSLYSNNQFNSNNLCQKNQGIVNNIAHNHCSNVSYNNNNGH